MTINLTPADIAMLRGVANAGRQAPAYYKGDWRFPQAAYMARNFLRRAGFTVTEDDSTGFVTVSE